MKPEDIRLNLRDTLELLFPDENNRLPVSTVQTWQQRGVFTPYEPAKPRDPRGSTLVLSDMVLLSLLNAFFSVGVRFDHILKAKPATAQFEQLSRLLDSAIGIPFWDGAGPRVDFDKKTLNETEKKRLAEEQTMRRRPIQIYLEAVNYNCVCEITRIPGVEPQLAFEVLDEETLKAGGPRWLGKEVLVPIPRTVTFIDVRDHHEFIVDKLTSRYPILAAEKDLLLATSALRLTKIKVEKLLYENRSETGDPVKRRNKMAKELRNFKKQMSEYEKAKQRYDSLFPSKDNTELAREMYELLKGLLESEDDS